MANTSLNRTGVAILTNKSGGDLAKGAVVILGTATAKAFTTTTTSGYKASNIGVVLEPNGIANNGSGAVALSAWVPKITLASSASLYDFIKCHTVAGQGTPHAAPAQAGDFAIALETGTTPSAYLFGIPYPTSFDPSAVDITGTLALSGDISPAQITSNQNDYSPTGLSGASTLRLNSDASRNITGLAGGADGRIISIYNTGSTDIVLKNNDSGSSAANRFKLQADITLVGGDGCLLIYDSTSSFWRCIGKTPGGSGGSVDNTAYDATSWDGDTTNAPSKNAVRDKIESLTGINWTQVINESGASFANFTSVSGTWASDGTIIKQTDTASSERSAKYNTKIFTSSMIAECELQLRTSGTQRTAGIVLGFSGSAIAGSAVAMIREGDDDVNLLISGGSYLISLGATININTWYKLRVAVFGTKVTFYLDGTLVGSYGGGSGNANGSFVGLYSFQAEAWFRNFKVWDLALPA